MNDIEAARARRDAKKQKLGVTRQVNTQTGEVFIGMYANGKLIWDGPRAEFFEMIHRAWRDGAVNERQMANFMDIAR